MATSALPLTGAPCNPAYLQGLRSQAIMMSKRKGARRKPTFIFGDLKVLRAKLPLPFPFEFFVLFCG